MIRHMVLFNLRDGLADAERDTLFDQIRAMSQIPSVGRIEIGSLLDPKDPAYRSHMSPDFGHALLVDFADEDALYAYQKDPLHVTVAAEIRKRVSAIKVTDFVTPD